jgi:PAS domain-containing protein
MHSKENSSNTPQNQINDKYIKNFLKHFYVPAVKEKLPETALIETDLFGKITNFSEEFLNIVSKSADSILNKEISTFLYYEKSVSAPVFLLKNKQPVIKNNSKIFILCNDNSFVSAELKVLKKTSPDSSLTGYSIILTDISNENQSEHDKSEIQKNAILQALIYSSERIIQAADTINETIIFDVLRHLGIAARANRVIIFENTKNPYGSDLMKLKYEWNSPGLFHIRENSALNKYKYSDYVFNILSRGESYQKKVNELHESDELLLKDHLIKSFVLIPLFSQNKFYGNLALADCQKPRTWTNEEKEGIEASARLIGQIINKVNKNYSAPDLEKSKINRPQAAPICIIDKYSKIIFSSTGFESLIGYSSSQTSNLPFTAFVKSNNNEFLKNFENILITKEPVKGLNIKLRNSAEKWIPVTIDMVHSNSDEDSTLIEINIKSLQSEVSPLSLGICNPYYDFNVDLSLILEKLPSPIWFTDKNKKFIYGNKAFFSKILAGAAHKDSIIGKRPEELSDKLGFLIKIIASEIEVNKSTLIERKLEGNKTHVFKIKKSMVFDYNKNFAGNLWYGEEETEIINAQKQVKAIEKKYKTVFENFPGAVFLKDSKGRYVYANNYMQKAYNMNGLPSKLKNNIPEHIVSKYTMEDLKAMREGKIETIDSIPEINGCNAIFKKIKFPVHSEAGENLIGGIAIDITREKNLEEKISKYQSRIEFLKSTFNSELENTQKKYNSQISLNNKKIDFLKTKYSSYFKFFYNSPLIFFWCNLSGKIIFMNNTWKDYFSTKTSEMRGKSLDIIFDHESKKNYYSLWRSLLSKKTDYGLMDANISFDKKILNVTLYLKLADMKSDTSFPGIIVIAIPDH